MLFPTPWLCGEKHSKVCEDFHPIEGEPLAVSELIAAFVATAARLLCAEYLTVSIRVSARSCLKTEPSTNSLETNRLTSERLHSPNIYQTDDNPTLW